MVLANPHFPWVGELRFSEVHLSTEDGMDVYGAQLLGLPAVGIGFTEGVAWTHTVSAGKRFTAYMMDLAPGDPTSYLMDGEAVPMESADVTIQVKGEDGQLTDSTRTFWSTEFGPVIDFPGVGWTEAKTVSYRDANFGNDSLLEQYRSMDRAQSVEELRAAQEDLQGIPLFNTIAADTDGSAWYADTSATPKLTTEAQDAYAARLESDGLTKIAAESGAVLLEGNTSRDRWVDDPQAPWPGVEPFSELPMVERSDYVMNANDSFWVPNGTEVLSGDYSTMHGSQDTARSVRTLENLSVLDDTAEDGPSGEDGLFDLDELMDASLRDSAYTEQQWRAGVVDRCRQVGGPVASPPLADADGAPVVPAAQVDLSEACDVLEAWDGRYDVDSAGAVLWREFTGQVTPNDLWATAFDPERPAVTPAGLGPAVVDGTDTVIQALAAAVALLQHRGIALDVPLGDLQFDARVPGATPQDSQPLPGGLGSEGVTNVVSDGSGSSSTTEEPPTEPEKLVAGSTLTAEGYPVSAGTSFLMAVELTEDGPVGHTILTYGQVGDPDKPGFTSGASAFAEKKWKPALFDRSDIEADGGVEVTEVSG